jgi:hypothetical protein
VHDPADRLNFRRSDYMIVTQRHREKVNEGSENEEVQIGNRSDTGRGKAMGMGSVAEALLGKSP